MKINYSDFNENDFAADENFQQWVLSPNEENNSYWHDWLIDNPDRKSYIEEARELVLLMEFKSLYIPEQHIEEIKRAYKAKIKIREPKSNKWIIEGIIKSIAAIALLSVLVYLLTDIYQHHNNYETYQTKNGQRLKVMLSDGSQVWLNGGTLLKYPIKNEAGKQRAILLNGEAYFSFSKSTGSQSIQAADMLLSDLAGSLNVSSYPDDEDITVAIHNGKASIAGDVTPTKEKMILEAGQIICFNKTSKKFSEQSGNALDQSSWKDGKLIIKDLPLKIVANKMERWYGRAIEVENEANCLISITIQEETLEDVLENLKTKFQLNYKKNGTTTMLSMKCKK